MTKINILTRTGTRDKYFKALNETILTQTYNNIRHIKSCDNDDCTFLDNEVDVFKVKRNRGAGRGFYNLYLNELASKVDDGWIIILDDDSKLIDDKFIENLANECSNSDIKDVLIYQSYHIEKKQKIPNDNKFKNKKVQLYNIDMSCFCAHYSLFNKVKFNGNLGGDAYIMDKIKKLEDYKFKFIDITPGIWANYDGQKVGSN